MRTDMQGTSKCPPGSEQYEYFNYYGPRRGELRVQYDYRTPEGQLFSCIAKSLEDARARRDAWLKEQAEQ